MAEYPGGIDSLLNYLRNKIKFDYQINGKIWITFNVNCNGIACGFNTYKKEGDISCSFSLLFTDPLRLYFLNLVIMGVIRDYPGLRYH